MEHLVSIIVPVYKVEKYIDRCIQSLINQTYKQLEIILVDDGSPDNCGKIADNYAAKDSRIKAFHKKNGGLSDARNYGAQYVTGKFTLFVDSDDWLEDNMVEKLVAYSLKYEADVVQSAFYYAHDDYLLYDNRYYAKDEPPVILNNYELMTELVINERVKNFAWGKLYKTSLIEDIPFEKGVLFEDVFWAHKVMERAERYVILHEPLCYYYQRDDSIVAAYTPRNLDIIKGLKERHAFIESRYPDLINESYRLILKTHLEHYLLLFLNRQKDPGGVHRKEIQNYITKKHDCFNKSIVKDNVLKMELQMFIIHPYFYIGLLGLYKLFRQLKLTPSPAELERIN
ncbi:glycosyltransferase family 2 protein [Salipaludibacillus aurantiacus]|uniref:Glycosyltransferase involved in cell wall bisynthesis n=1 Tax=Salipaludibacillus aurantiacus TaxID=1601833 RepID=A0A1H9UK76_9BACI|nr:glycosyltransferase [Salipaludibacillus aurantiacus]SES09855.1 Glycosyltransferase involved in cell wall bisynthesis [Salipaludibacillus aurantiacus]